MLKILWWEEKVVKGLKIFFEICDEAVRGLILTILSKIRRTKYSKERQSKENAGLQCLKSKMTLFNFRLSRFISLQGHLDF